MFKEVVMYCAPWFKSASRIGLYWIRLKRAHSLQLTAKHRPATSSFRTGIQARTKPSQEFPQSVVSPPRKPYLYRACTYLLINDHATPIHSFIHSFNGWIRHQTSPISRSRSRSRSMLEIRLDFFRYGHCRVCCCSQRNFGGDGGGTVLDVRTYVRMDSLGF